jgi:hypothetical protein
MKDPVAELRESHRLYLAALGMMVMKWNVAESFLRHLVASLLDGSGSTRDDRKYILVSELGPIGIQHALNTFADDFQDTELRDALRHVSKYYELLRGHRNYYAHGIINLVPENAGIYGNIHYLEAKGKLIRRRDLIDVTALNQVTQNARALYYYVQRLLDHIPEKSKTRRMPDKPPLPPSVSKSAIYLAAPPPPRRSSRA